MSKRGKLRQKLRNNPRNATKQDIETLLLGYGFVLDRVSGSHHIYTYKVDDVTHRLVIPFHGQKVKVDYVLWALEVLDEIEAGESDDDSEDA